jgi:hypothetical protein
MIYTDDKAERLRRIVMACIVLQNYACKQLQIKQDDQSGAYFPPARTAQGQGSDSRVRERAVLKPYKPKGTNK